MNNIVSYNVLLYDRLAGEKTTLAYFISFKIRSDKGA